MSYHALSRHRLDETPSALRPAHITDGTLFVKGLSLPSNHSRFFRTPSRSKNGKGQRCAPIASASPARPGHPPRRPGRIEAAHGLPTLHDARLVSRHEIARTPQHFTLHHARLIADDPPPSFPLCTRRSVRSAVRPRDGTDQERDTRDSQGRVHDPVPHGALPELRVEGVARVRPRRGAQGEDRRHRYAQKSRPETLSPPCNRAQLMRLPPC